MEGPKEIFDTVSSNIKHESSLITSRIGWLFTFQGFLVAGYSLVDKLVSNQSNFLEYGIPIFGISITLFIALGIIGANRSISKSKKFWEDKKVTELPQPFGDKISSNFGRACSWGLIVVIIYFWLAILYTNLICN